MRRFCRRAFVVGIWLLVASVLLQFLLAGLGIFANATFFLWHTNVNGAVVFFLPLLLVLVGWLGRVPGRTLLLTAAVTGLALVQSLLLIPYHMRVDGLLRGIAGLHVLNALLIFWIVMQLLERTRALELSPSGAP